MPRKRKPTLEECEELAYRSCTLADFQEIVTKAKSRVVDQRVIVMATVMLFDVAANGTLTDWRGIWALLEHKCPMMEGARRLEKRRQKK